MLSKWALSSACLLSLAALSVSAQIAPVGGELQANSHTQGAQSYAAVAVDADGDFVVVWTSYGQDGDGGGIFARRFSAAGVAQATEFQVHSFFTNSQFRPAVATDGGGNFVVVWSSNGQDGQGGGIFARRFSAAGDAQATEFQVNSFTASGQYRPAVALDADGDFVVAWTSEAQDGDSFGVFAQRFGAAGDPQAAELQVNSFTPSGQYHPALSLDTDGDFVVAWQSTGQDGDSAGIFARRFSAAGDPQAAEFQVNSFTTGLQYYAAVSLDTDGDFVIAWTGYDQDGSDGGIFAQRFSAAGLPQSAELQVNSFTPNGQYHAAVALGADGDFVVAWGSYGQDGYFTGVFASHFGGAAPQAEFQVNSYTVSSQYFPAVDLGANGDFVVAWQSYGQDGNDAGVFAQRFKLPPLAVLDVDGNGVVTSLGDGLMILKYNASLRDENLISGGVGAGCMRCTADEIEEYIEFHRLQFDVDGNTFVTSLGDGLMILKYNASLRDENLISGGVGAGCSRCMADEIEVYIEDLKTP